MAKTKEIPQLVVKSALKEYIAGFTGEGEGGGNMRTSGELGEALNGKIAALIDDAVGRAKANGRSTVRIEDF